MLETSARLLRLLALLQGRRDWSAVDLADRLEVTPRTVRRDVERLRRLGYPVDARPGTGGGYRLGAGAELPPLLLDDEEAVAVALGLSAAWAGGVAGLGETAVRAMAKLEQVLPSRLRHRVRTLQAAVEPMNTDTGGTDPDVLLTVATAVRDHQRLRVDYTTHDGTQARRDVEPYRIVQAGRRWYLLAWDVDRAAWRTLRLDRLSPRTPSGPRFVPREPPDDVARYVARGITTRAYPHEARLTMHAAAEVVREHLPHGVAVVTPLDDASCEVVVGSRTLRELALYVGLVGVDFEVHEPAELRSTLTELGTRLLRAAREPAGPTPPGPVAHDGAASTS